LFQFVSVEQKNNQNPLPVLARDMVKWFDRLFFLERNHPCYLFLLFLVLATTSSLASPIYYLSYHQLHPYSRKALLSKQNTNIASLVSKHTTRGTTTGFVGTEATYAPQQKQQQQQQRDKITEPKKTTKLLPRDPVYLWSALIAGVGSGALSSVICAPLDLIRTRLQVRGDLNLGDMTLRRAFTEIMDKEGPRGYFRGLGASLLTVPSFWGVYFPLYDDMKRRLLVAYPDIEPSFVHCGSAVVAGAVSDFLCNPLFVVSLASGIMVVCLIQAAKKAGI
jgi:Mitochondrial carrier protein